MKYLNKKIIYTSLLIGILAYIFLKINLVLVIPHSYLIHDFSEIFVFIGSILTGPFGSTIISLIISFHESSPSQQLIAFLLHAVGGAILSLIYQRYFIKCKTGIQLIFLWIILTCAYFFIFHALLLFILESILKSNIFDGQVNYNSSIWVKGFGLSVVITTLILIASPVRYIQPLWKYSTHSNVFRSFSFTVKSISVRVIIWLLITASFPIYILTLYLTQDVSKIALSREATVLHELAYEFANRSNSLDGKTFVKILKDNQVNREGRLFIIDLNGKYLLHPVSSKNNTHASADYSNASISKILTKKDGYYIDDDNRICFGFSLFKSPNHSFIIVATSDPQVLEALISGMQAAAFYKIGSVLLLIAFFLGSVLWIMVKKPLNIMLETIHKISAGQSSARIDLNAMDDEIEIVARSFNQMADKLAREENKYFEMVNFLPQSVFEADLSGNITFLNNSALQLFGIRKEEVSNKFQLRNFIHPDFRPQLQSNIKLLLETGLVKGNEYTAVKKDGSAFPILTYTSVLTEGNSSIGLRGIAVDITERKNAELELKQSEKNFSDLFNLSPIPMVLASRDEKILHINERFTRIFGYTSNDISILDDWWSLAYPDSEIRNRIKSHWLNSVGHAFSNGGEIKPAEFSVKCKNGDTRFVIIEAKVVNKNVLTSFFDITESKLASIALQESETKFKTIFDLAPYSCVVSDMDGKYIMANKYFYDATGFTEEQTIGHTNMDLGLDSEFKTKAVFEELIKKGEVGPLEFNWTDPTGKLFSILYNSKLVYLETDPVILSVTLDISEMNRAKLALEESEDKFRSIIQGLNDMIVIINEDGIITYQSPSVSRTLGYELDELIGKHALAITHPEDHLLASNNVEEAFSKNEGTLPAITRILKKDSGFIFMESIGINMIQNKAVNGIVIFGRDITDKIKSEKALHESEEMLRKLVGTVPDVIARTDLDGNIIFINESSVPFLSFYPNEQLLGKNLRNFIAPEDRSRAEENLLKMLEAPIGIQEYRIKPDHDSDSIVFCEINGGIIRDHKMNPLEYVFVIRDISERKKVEELIKTSSENFKRIFHKAPYSMVITQLANPPIILEVNEAHNELFGYSRDELVGLPSRSLVDPESEKRMSEEFRLFGKLDDFEAIIYRLGKEYRCLISSREIEYNNSRCILTVVKDVTKQRENEKELENYRINLENLIKERTGELQRVNILLEQEIVKQKKSEERVKEALEKEKELSELKTRFISTASHEFRTPLTTIYSSVQLLEKYGKSWNAEMYDTQFSRIKEYVQYMTKIMDDVLTISRADSGKIKFDPIFIDLSQLCRNLVQDINVIITKAHKLIFNFSIRKKQFYLDEKLIKYILLNLLSNAIKYSPNGGKIEFTVKKNDDFIIFEISDEGIGIPEKDQPFLFDPFHRGKNVNEIQGTGLGMSIVKKSVDIHGGTISFVSKENQGSKFIVTIPVREK